MVDFELVTHDVLSPSQLCRGSLLLAMHIRFATMITEKAVGERKKNSPEASTKTVLTSLTL